MRETTIRPAIIRRIVPDSIAADIGFEVGDAIVSINGTRPRDLIDYRYLCADEVLTLVVLDPAGNEYHIDIEKDDDDDLGLEFVDALFDGLMQCNNHCPFCFIDQQPPGKRATLYLKDDDYRLSFLYGSYLTLTNLSPKEWQRIEAMRLSPLYVSIHATDPVLRCRLLKNSRGGQILDQLHWFQARRLQIHGQVVLCPGINDGPHLTNTLLDLARFHQADVPAIVSVAVVPVGLTRFRPDGDDLHPVSPAKATEVIHQVQALQQQFYDQWGTNFVWLADEWFLIAQQDLPEASHYESYPQLGNGVGSIRQFIQEFHAVAEQCLPEQIAPLRQLTWVVGSAVAQAFEPLVARLNAVAGLQVQLAALPSDYWGREMVVTGLLTGQDLLQGLRSPRFAQTLGDAVLIPSLMLKHDEAKFLDDMSVAQVAQQLQVPLLSVDDIPDLLQTCLGDIQGFNRTPISHSPI